jgi:NAD(P)-dependent dehydrogenase (short-subunit alcohol dehydrogenase family)
MQPASRVVLVTGASSGFGKAIAAALAAGGHKVFGGARRAPADPPAGVTNLSLDVTDESSVKSCVAAVIAAAGSIDAVINNAGMGIAGAIEDTTVEEAKTQFETNFFGTHRVCRAVLPHMRAQRRGHIINMSSLAGHIPLPFQGFYSATKFAIEAYSEALRMELRPFGIAVSMIEPGDFATGFTASRRMTSASDPQSAYREACERAIARMARDEQANADLTPVVSAVQQILANGRPALRHPRATAVQRGFVALRPFMPDALVEYLIRDTYGLK